MAKAAHESKTREHCHLANEGCLAPAGYRTMDGGVREGTLKVTTKCSVCCEPTCTGPLCSRMRAGDLVCDSCRDVGDPPPRPAQKKSKHG